MVNRYGRSDKNDGWLSKISSNAHERAYPRDAARVRIELDSSEFVPDEPLPYITLDESLRQEGIEAIVQAVYLKAFGHDEPAMHVLHTSQELLRQAQRVKNLLGKA